MTSRRPRSGREAILRPAQGRYLRGLLSPRDSLLAGAERRVRDSGWPPRDPATVRLLEVLAATREPGRVLDLSCGSGESTLAVARGAPRASIVAVEGRAELAEAARELLAAGLVAGRVELREEEPVAALEQLAGPFDLVLLDATARGARRLLDLILPLLAVRGLLVADRCLGGGRLADPGVDDLDDPDRRALEVFNPYLMIHPQLRAVMLPVGEGVALASKSRPLVLELGGPF